VASPVSENREIVTGLGVTALLHLLQLPLAGLAMLVSCATGGYLCQLAAILPPLLIGASQVVYMGPAIFIAFRRQRRALAKGLIIGAAITLALNAACWGLFTGVARF
jgi:hypothetical protein